MKYLPTEQDRYRVQRLARQQARVEGYGGRLRELRASVLELEFWQRWRALDEDAQLATFHSPTLSSRSI